MQMVINGTLANFLLLEETFVSEDWMGLPALAVKSTT